MTNLDLNQLEALAKAATPVEGMPGFFVTRDGVIISKRSWRGHAVRVLKPVANGRGYLKVRYSRDDGKRINAAVHVIVAHTFLGPKPSPAHEVRHLNGDATDNRAENLAWGTRRENATDRGRHGRTAIGKRNGMHTHPDSRARGERNGNCRISDSEVMAIRNSTDGPRAIAAKFNVSRTYVQLLRKGTWR